jgi:hypothetical protein
MGDFDDMNATPLGKLPMPTVQSKQDEPRLDMGPNYADILKEMQASRERPAAAAGSAALASTAAPAQFPQQAPGADYAQYGMGGGIGQGMQGMQGMGGGMQGMQGMQGHQAGMQGHQAGMQGHQAGMHDYPQAPRGYSAPRHRPRRRPRDDDEYEERRGEPSRLMRVLREYKSSIFVTAIVFFVLWYAAPKLAAAAPQLLTPSGKFSVVGLLVIASTAGGIHRAADHFIR